MKNLRAIWIISLVASVAAVAVWTSTGRDWYTKFQIVEVLEAAVDSEDLFAATGLYDGDTQIKVEQRDEFRLGLLPSGADKHLISVATIVLPLWLASAALWLRGLRRRQSKLQ